MEQENKGEENTVYNADISKAYEELARKETYLIEHVDSLKHMIFKTTHELRQPVTNILGIVPLLEGHIKDTGEGMVLINYLKQSAEILDAISRQMITYMSDLGQKGIINNWLNKSPEEL